MLTKTIRYLEKKPVWIIGLFLLFLSFLPCILLGQNSIIESHDQLDGPLFTYLLSAKYLFTDTKVFPELLGGVSKSGMSVTAPLFVLLYRFFSPFIAYLLQYIIVSLCAYLGMYLLISEFTNAKILASIIALLFSLLPFIPLYGLSLVGQPLLLYAFLCLYRKKKIFLSYLLIVFFAATSSIVLIGYAYLLVGGLFLLYSIFTQKRNKFFFWGYCLLLFAYCLTNISLISDTFFSSGSFLSHREEFVLNSLPFWASLKGIIMGSGEHAPSFHISFILPTFIIQIIQSIRYRKLTSIEKKGYKSIWILLAIVAVISFIYALYYFAPIVAFRETLPVSIKHFQFHRFYWMLPSIWYIIAGLDLISVWNFSLGEKAKISFLIPYAKVLIILLLLLPCAITTRRASLYRLNLNQLQNQGDDYGISWEEHFSCEQYKEIAEYIGQNQNEYKVASLGIDPGIALYNGFYCIDGYSNNYSLEYKHEFRKIIEKEIEKSDALHYYFDGWGSRCFLFAAQTSTSFDIRKDSDFIYTDLELDTAQMKALGCDYLLCAAPITNADELNLKLLQCFHNNIGIYNIYLYQITF